jgi:hypothetical protein
MKAVKLIALVVLPNVDGVEKVPLLSPGNPVELYNEVPVIVTPIR